MDGSNGGNTPRIPLLALVGPTASGKTRLSIDLAERLDGEIVNADSRQVYRRMDIATAKPAPEERARVPHHGFDLVNPDEPFPLTAYLAFARSTIAAIAARGNLPILAGGTGLYVRGILDGLVPPEVAPDPAFRASLEARAAAGEADALFETLRQADPLAATRIDPRNIRRVIRALEVIHVTGRPFSEGQQRIPTPYDTLTIGLTLDRAALHARIAARIEEMFRQGLLEETQALIDAGYSADLPSMSGIGYAEAIGILEGRFTLEEGKELIRRRSHRLVRQQYTWFRLDDPSITWNAADAADLTNQVLRRIDEWRQRCDSPKCTESATTS